MATCATHSSTGGGLGTGEEAGQPGGSGSGAGYQTSCAGAGNEGGYSPPEGNPGGTSYTSSPQAGGGGGGAGAAGQNAQSGSEAGEGGAGFEFPKIPKPGPKLGLALLLGGLATLMAFGDKMVPYIAPVFTFQS